MNKKPFLIFLTITLLVFAYSCEYLVDVAIGDGDGVVTKPGFHYIFLFLKISSICFTLYVIPVKVFSFPVKTGLTNLFSKPVTLQKRLIFLVLVCLTWSISSRCEYLLDLIIGDGDGQVNQPGLQRLFLPMKIALICLSLYFLLIKVFSISVKTLSINVIILAIIIYGFEFYLYKTDTFLKLPFDSGYYYGGKIKYSFMKFDYDPINPYITWGHPTRKNNYGYRGGPINEKKDSTFRIAVFGDSFTWGAGLEENERYSNKLDSICKLHYKNVEVVNCGLSGAPTITERDSIRNLIKKLKADMVIVGFCPNDPLPPGENYSVERDAFNKKYTHKLELIQERLAFIHLHYLGASIAKAFENLAMKSGKIPPLSETLGRAYNKKSKDWQDFANALKDVKAISDSNHCAFDPAFIIFRYIGYLDYETEKGADERKEFLKVKTQWMKQVYEAGKEAGLITIDTHESVLKDLNSGKLTMEELPVSPLDGHPSAKLNTVYALDLFTNLKMRLDACRLVRKN
ncbi:MAG TPA: SGNH/GDSL hydrolase family protein [Bacteroidia bacterium]|jgi:hypothetical protein|nr:SGNH/GDSL hydrolase family protein [Bacteroidia bacterium]